MPLRDPNVCVLRSIAIVTVVLIACATVVLATPAEDAYKQGNDLLKKKDYKAAVTALDKAIRLDCKHVDSYIARAAAYCQLGQCHKAIADCNKAMSLVPLLQYDAGHWTRREIEIWDREVAEAYYYRAKAYEKLGKDDLADKDLEKAKELGYQPARK